MDLDRSINGANVWIASQLHLCHFLAMCKERDSDEHSKINIGWKNMLRKWALRRHGVSAASTNWKCHLFKRYINAQIKALDV